MFRPADAPRVTVITPVHNGERFLSAAIESILGQTFTAFEYMVVDDASSDGTPQVLASWAARDSRIVALRTPHHCGHSRALNVALQLAHSEYVAILDADDLAHAERLQRQVHFLNAHPAVGVVGAQAHTIDEQGRVLGPRSFPITGALARWIILFGTPVLHSAAMVRRALLQEVGGYATQWRYANDYHLWAALIGRTQITNLPETLVAYRVHDRQTSSTHTLPQQGCVWLLIYRMLAERLALRAALDDIGVLYHGARGVPLDNAAALERAARLLAAIRERYLAVEQPDPSTAAQIDADCARRLLTMAWVHRRTQRAAGRGLLARALELDPLLWRRPQTRALLRRMK